MFRILKNGVAIIVRVDRTVCNSVVPTDLCLRLYSVAPLMLCLSKLFILAKPQHNRPLAWNNALGVTIR